VSPSELVANNEEVRRQTIAECIERLEGLCPYDHPTLEDALFCLREMAADGRGNTRG